jgi:hypothetical protein
MIGNPDMPKTTPKPGAIASFDGADFDDVIGGLLAVKPPPSSKKATAKRKAQQAATKSPKKQR